MKTEILYRLIFFFFAVAILLASYGNANTDAQKHYEELFDSAYKERMDKNYAKALEYLYKSKVLVEANDWDGKRAIVLNQLGIIYWQLSDFEKAMEYYLEAYKIAIKISDRKMEEGLLNNIASLYETNEEYHKAIEYLRKAYDISTEINDSGSIALVACNIGIIYDYLKEYDIAAKYLDEGIEIAENMSDKNALYQIYGIYIGKIQNLFHLEKYNEAEELSLRVLRDQQENGSVFLQDKQTIFFYLSHIYQKKGEIQKAIYYAQEALRSKPMLKQVMLTYNYLSELYQQNGSLDIALQYKDSAFYAMDSLQRINNKNYTEGNRIKFEVFNLEKTLAENQAKQKAERILLISILTFIIILAIVLIWIFRIQSIRNRQRKQITELELQQEKNRNLLEEEQLNNENLRLEQQLKEKETIALLEQERLQNEVNEKLLLKQQLKEQEMVRLLEQERLSSEIDTKNKQLIAKALSQSDKNELLKEVVSLLSNISQQSDNPQLGVTIRKLNAQLKKSTDWDNFLTQFERINPSFFYSLKEEFPTLTANDIHLLSYIYLNLDTQKVSELLNISAEAYRQKKHRLAGKMGLETTELYVFLVNKIKFQVSK